MNVSSATLRESQPRNFTRVDSAPQVNQNSNASNEALNQGAFSSRAVSFTTNTGVRQVLSEVLGAPAWELVIRHINGPAGMPTDLGYELTRR